MPTPNARHEDPDFPDEDSTGFSPKVMEFPPSEMRGDLEPLPYVPTVEPHADDADETVPMRRMPYLRFPSERAGTRPLLASSVPGSPVSTDVC